VTTFLRLLSENDKAEALSQICDRLRQGEPDPRCFSVAPESFDAVPGKPFAYWVSEAILGVFAQCPSVEESVLVTSGTGTLDDFRFLRCWWEIRKRCKWYPFAKGGAYSPTYYDQHLVVGWALNGAEMKEWIVVRYGGGHWARNIRSTEHYFRPGLTWPRRTNGLSFRAMPAGCIFADKGPAAFVPEDNSDTLLALSSLLNSRAFGFLVSIQLARTELAQSYEVGIIQKTPIPPQTVEQTQQLALLARRAWSLRRTLDTVTETSHAFVLPAALRGRLGDYDPPSIEAELLAIQAEIDARAFDLYGFAEADRQAANGSLQESDGADSDDEESEAREADLPSSDALLSWAVGVSFGRFDWRLATGERAAPPEPEPFDPLPTQSPGMLPDGARPFHAHAGILVDDPGHAHDLAHLVEEVLARVAMPVPDDVRRWLQRDFFAFHLQRYSKSRRKAPIHWPLATASGSYTLWLHYPRLDSQTLYTAINDFIEPRLKQVGSNLATLRTKGPARSRDDEKRFETLQTLEAELSELRDTLLKIAPHYHPNHDDGVQITAAPLWPLFRHKPWQKILKDTWAKLENGDYDWAHLAMNYWPERVREKCKTDKSLAIAHGLETLYVEPEAKAKKTRVKKKSEGEI
jgi:hypothetical protein